MLKKQFMICLIATFGFLQFGSASAATLDLILSSNSVIEGDTFTVDVVISGLVEPGEFISTYNIDVAYDPGSLMATDVTFGTLLGSGSLTDANYLPAHPLFVPGIVNIFELSFLSDNDLKTNQGSSVNLASISFLAIAISAGDISIDPLFTDIVGDVNSALQVDLDSVVSYTVSPIPLPGALWLMITGVIGIGAMARKRGSAI